MATPPPLYIFFVNLVQKTNKKMNVIIFSFVTRYILSSKLPVISYMTTLDKYSIFAQIFLVLLCAWHAIIGCNYFRKQDKVKTQYLDNVGLITIAVLYIMYHLGYLIYFLVKLVRNSNIDKPQRILEAAKLKEERELADSLEPEIESSVSVKAVVKAVEPAPLPPPPALPAPVKEKPAKAKVKQPVHYSTITDINSDSFFNQKLKDIEIDPNRPVSYGYQLGGNPIGTTSSSIRKPNEPNRNAYFNTNTNSGVSSGGRNIQFQDYNDAKATVNNPFGPSSSTSYRRTVAN